MEENLLEFRDVTGKSRKFRLEHISFSLPTGYICGLAGGNGAGKTTLMNYIMEDKKLYTGTISLKGRDIHADREWTKNRIGFVSEENPFFTERSAKQNGELLGMFYEDFDMELFLDTLRQMGDLAGKVYKRMSRGEKLKFQLAFAMAHHPALYLMDEVTVGMDPVFRMEFFQILHRLMEEENAGILMTSHIESEMERHMDYVGVLEKGNMIQIPGIPERKEQL